MGRDGAHLRLVLNDGHSQFTAVGFHLGGRTGAIPRMVDVAYGLAINEWNGNRRLELRVRDLRASE